MRDGKPRPDRHRWLSHREVCQQALVGPGYLGREWRPVVHLWGGSASCCQRRRRAGCVLGPEVDTLTAGAAPVVLAGLDYIADTLGPRRLEHATQTLTDAAHEFGAETTEGSLEFVKAAVSDQARQELLARARARSIAAVRTKTLLLSITSALYDSERLYTPAWRIRSGIAVLVIQSL